MAQIIINAGSGSNGVRSEVRTTWSDARDDATGKETTNFITQATNGGGGAFQCGRCFIFFDLSTIPVGSKIETATLVHPIVTNYTAAAGGSIYVTKHTASDPVDTASFNDLVSLNSDTTYGSITYANISTSETKDITIDTAGKAYLESVLGGTAKFGLRSSFDKDNSSPSGSSQYTCTVADFDLELIYNPPGGFAAIFI